MNIVLFDGICNFCNSTVLQIIKYDKANKLKFSSLQSDFGKKTLKSLKMEEDNLNTLIFIKNSINCLLLEGKNATCFLLQLQ
jgi:predicted DCC family thiol-disulfide oxidoreductase YuxK